MNLTSIENLLNSVDDFFYTYLLAALLILAGIYLTMRTFGVQLRHFGTMVNSLSGSRSGAQGGISSFQAFAVGLAARVGIGNIAGVALAVVAGGPAPCSGCGSSPSSAWPPASWSPRSHRSSKSEDETSPSVEAPPTTSRTVWDRPCGARSSPPCALSRWVSP